MTDGTRDCGCFSEIKSDYPITNTWTVTRHDECKYPPLVKDYERCLRMIDTLKETIHQQGIERGALKTEIVKQQEIMKTLILNYHNEIQQLTKRIDHWRKAAYGIHNESCNDQSCMKLIENTQP